MRRAVLFAVLSLLLLAMQHQGYVHPIAHLAGGALPSQETQLSSSEPHVDCVQGALLAGGFHAVPSSNAPQATSSPPVALVFASYHSRAAEVPAWFESRAPPVLL